MLQKITVKIDINKHRICQPPVIQERRVWAWVRDGWALHRSVASEFTPAGSTAWLPGWTITHVASGLRLPTRDDRKSALRIFRGLRDVSVNGKSLVDMSVEEMRGGALASQLHELFRDPNATYIGGCHQ